MHKAIGVWIDRREAVIVQITEIGKDVQHIRSHLETHSRFSGRATEVATPDAHDRRFANLLGQFYDSIISNIREADSIQIFGPDQTKTELQTRLAGAGLERRIVGIVSAEKMTDREFAAMVTIPYPTS